MNDKKEISILFIGNSLTYYYDMPTTLQKMFNKASLNFKVSQSTFPGISLHGHLNDIVTYITDSTVSSRIKKNGDTTQTEKALRSKNWNYVVLQEGTVRLLIPEVKRLQVIPAIQEIKNELRGSKTEFILFKTWASLDTFPKQYCYPSRIVDKSITKAKCCSPTILSFEEETKLINYACDSVAKATGMTILPITNCFAEIVKKYPNINLYDDESHPSKLGAYLNACIYFKYFTKRKANTIKYYSDIDEKIALLIQNVVDENY